MREEGERCLAQAGMRAGDGDTKNGIGLSLRRPVSDEKNES
jgi:hypothetical protein